MADRSFYYCPFCEKNNVKVELFRGAPELHLHRCQYGHCFTSDQLQELHATMIKMEFQEKPGPLDVKAEVWVSQDLWQKFCAKFPNRKSSTMASIMGMCLDDDLVIISGEQARKLKQFNIKNGTDMLSCAEENVRLTGENADLSKDVTRIYAAMGQAAQMVEQ